MKMFEHDYGSNAHDIQENTQKNPQNETRIFFLHEYNQKLKFEKKLELISFRY